MDPTDDPSSQLFGMRFSGLDAAGAADVLLDRRRTAAQGVALFVTPNIQHIAAMRHHADFAEAMRGAELVVADGFPVYRYARWRGLSLPERVTGREVVDAMLAAPDRLARHRMVFVVDTEETAAAIRGWMTAHVPAAAIATIVPPHGFDRDPAEAGALAERIAAFGATLLFMGIGAPRSEVFVDRHRALLPPCWALCIGQSFRIALGLTTPPPPLLVRLDLEWLWRIRLEPKRMLKRYGPSSLGFLAAAFRDWRAAMRRHGASRPRQGGGTQGSTQA